MKSQRILPSVDVPHGLGALWRARELVWFLIWRDWRVRYRQTWLGAWWALLQPALLAAIFSVFLGQLNRWGDLQVPYSLFVLTGMVPWLLFSNGTTQAANSLVNHAELIKKAAFPRLVLPIAAIGGFVPDFLLGGVVVVTLASFLTGVSARMLFAPIAGLFAVLCAGVVGITLSALHARFRDVRFATPFILQAWLFATPIVYPTSLLPQTAAWLVAANPMSGPVILFQWSLGVLPDLHAAPIASSLTVSLLALPLSLRHFLRVEDVLADVV